ncbi:hypothetical protein CathTA2_2950 [Caldalkalibacillus thermarum TA2.A1]|uniref:Prepilin-type N-terminal cleavage/methylation domain-containing protein n=2 Tax=Caldalkalibacillus thermarum (strain TA2.A1) TaxID=986075 RepID=F5LAL5_CALTT|nr:hypothetical protein CathTA2_2950 [Caldalkalibacillus thermarum TA2.A1]
MWPMNRNRLLNRVVKKSPGASFSADLSRQKGLTLVEVLVALLIFSIIALLVMTVIVNSVNAFNKLKTEERLRAEADWIMTLFIRELYAARQLELVEEGVGEKDCLVKLYDQQGQLLSSIGFVDGDAVIDGQVRQSEPFVLHGSTIHMEDSEVIRIEIHIADSTRPDSRIELESRLALFKWGEP